MSWIDPSLWLGNLVFGALVAVCTWLTCRPGRGLCELLSALDSSASAVVIVRGFTIVTVNETTVKMLGFESRAEIEGQDLSALLSKADAGALQSEFAHYQRDGDAAIFTTRGESRPAPTPRAVRARRAQPLCPAPPRTHSVVTGRCQNGADVSLSLVVSPAAVQGDYVVWMRGRDEPVAVQHAELMLLDVLAALETLAEPVVAIKGHAIVSVNEATLTTFGYRCERFCKPSPPRVSSCDRTVWCAPAPPSGVESCISVTIGAAKNLPPTQLPRLVSTCVPSSCNRSKDELVGKSIALLINENALRADDAQAAFAQPGERRPIPPRGTCPPRIYMYICRGVRVCVLVCDRWICMCVCVYV